MANDTLDRLVEAVSDRIARKFMGASFETPMPHDEHRDLHGKAGWERMRIRIKPDTWEVWDLGTGELVARGRHDDEETLDSTLASWT